MRSIIIMLSKIELTLLKKMYAITASALGTIFLAKFLYLNINKGSELKVSFFLIGAGLICTAAYFIGVEVFNFSKGNKTYEFYFSLPISRNSIVTGKILAGIIVWNLVFLLHLTVFSFLAKEIDFSLLRSSNFYWGIIFIYFLSVLSGSYGAFTAGKFKYLPAAKGITIIIIIGAAVWFAAKQLDPVDLNLYFAFAKVFVKKNWRIVKYLLVSLEILISALFIFFTYLFFNRLELSRR